MNLHQIKLPDRMVIEQLTKKGYSVSEISQQIGMSMSSIYREYHRATRISYSSEQFEPFFHDQKMVYSALRGEVFSRGINNRKRERKYNHRNMSRL